MEAPLLHLGSKYHLWCFCTDLYGVTKNVFEYLRILYRDRVKAVPDEIVGFCTKSSGLVEFVSPDTLGVFDKCHS